MIIACPNCGTKFNVPEEAYRPGRKSRCSNCLHIFPLPDAEELAVSAKAAEQAQPERASAPADPLPEKRSPLKKLSRRNMAIAGIALAGLLVAGAGIYLMLNAGDAPQKAQTKAIEDEKVAETYKSLAVRMEEYTVKNEKLGEVFVVTGSVTNNFPMAKSFIMLELVLYDAQDKTIMTKRQYCGTTLSLLQLQSYSAEDLQANLANHLDVMVNNTNIAPGKSVPFMIAVPKPAGLESFSIAPVSAINVGDPLPEM